MNINFKIFLLVILVLTVSISFTVSDDLNDKISDEIVEELGKSKEVPVIVKFKESRSISVASKKVSFNINKEGLKEIGFKEEKELEKFNVVVGNVTEKVLEKLKDDPNIEFVQVDHKFSIALQDSVPLINATEVHEFVINNNITGLDLGVCILDSGVNYTHESFDGRCFGPGCEIRDGYDFINTDSDPYDDHGHGTHVTGIVDAVAPNTTLIHIKVLNSAGSGTESGITNGIDWCVSNRSTYNITAISMSIGSDSVYSSYCDSTFTLLTTAINNAIRDNITVFAASGNDGSTTGITSPGCIENATAVGATDKSNNIASYTNRNILLDILAPGSDISSISWVGNNNYETQSGTSMSTPHASGASALIQQYHYEQNNSLGQSAAYLHPYILQVIFNETGLRVSDWMRVNIKDAISQVDNIEPEIYLDYPINGTIFNLMENISLNFTSSDRFLGARWYHIDSNENISLVDNVSFFPKGGNHILWLQVNDTKGNVNSTFVSFGLDIPLVTIIGPDDNYNSLDGELYFNCSVSDLSELSNISLYHNHSSNWEINQTESLSGLQANVTFNLNMSGSLTFGWNCLSFDNNSFFALDDNRTIRVNYNNAPTIDYSFPVDISVNISEPDDQTFNLSYSDVNGDELSVTWYLDGNSISFIENYTFDGNYTSNGSYNVTVVVNDSLSSNSTYWDFIISNLEFCGDSVKNETEACDTKDYGSFTGTCSNYDSKWATGNLACDSSCIIDEGGCSQTAPDSGGDSGSGGGGGGGSPIEENLEPTPVVTESGEEESDDVEEFEAEETIEVAEEPEEIVEEEPEKIQFIGKWYSWGNLKKYIGYGVVGVLALVGLFFFFMKEYMLIKAKKI